MIGVEFFLATLRSAAETRPATAGWQSLRVWQPRAKPMLGKMQSCVDWKRNATEQSLTTNMLAARRDGPYAREKYARPTFPTAKSSTGSSSEPVEPCAAMRC